MTGLKAIETRYKGYRFRSRLEARWAVFFDALGIRYQYEPQGFDLDGVWYLPDFHLPDMMLWAEVKPTSPLSDADREKVGKLNEALEEEYKQNGYTGGKEQLVVLYGEPYRDREEQCYSIGAHWGTTFLQCVICGHVNIGHEPQRYDNIVQYQCECCDYGECRGGGKEEYARQRWREWFHKGDILAPLPFDPAFTFGLGQAYTAARSARFEHGETP